MPMPESALRRIAQQIDRERVERRCPECGGPTTAEATEEKDGTIKVAAVCAGRCPSPSSQ
ncbi:hypothetical protein SAMN05192584_108147 [Streptomyces pini]|uniref:Uncharacterized protein n=2 Tax=Streptomyces pini TaxID=1520580 RepID=A0A1I4BUS0_9ACTN|nr:hypothetical protein SAMN05192584_108147 [Streptomyces pini]